MGMRSASLAVGLILGFSLASSASAAEDAESWLQAFDETGTIRILTHDESGEIRDTPIWVVVHDGAAWVRTNDSAWLANIRRGSSIEIQAEAAAQQVVAEEVVEAGQLAEVEAAFKTKYGFVQEVMSFFRVSAPEVLRLTPAP